VTLKINELAEEIKVLDDENKRRNSLNETLDYTTLKKVLSDKLNRVL
jgi:DNA primase